MGYYTVLLTNKTGQIRQRNEYDEVHLMKYCDLSNKSKVIEEIKELQKKSLEIKTIISFVDPYCGLAAELCEEFKLPGFNFIAINNMQNKILSRKALQGTPLEPRFVELDYPHYNLTNQLYRMFPLVIKYVASNGSKDVYYVETAAAYYDSIIKILSKYQRPKIICEEYIIGPQYLVEVIVNKDEVNIVAIIKQDIEFLNGHFIVTGYTTSFDEDEQFYNSLKEAVTTIISKHDYHHGPCHLEMRLSSNGWKLVEMNPRISGAGMNKLIEASLGISLVKETIKLSLNEPIDLEPKFKRYTYAEYITVTQSGRLQKVTGEYKAVNSKGVVEVFIKPRRGQYLCPPRSLGDRYAYVIANGDSEDEAITNSKEAAKNLQFHLNHL